MPRDGSNIYHRPPGTDAITDTTVASAPYNGYTADVEQDLNLPRPIVAGGTGASSADAALTALSGEKAKQIVVNFDTMVWLPGSFYAATTATAPPVAAHAFAGIAYYANATDLVVEARDLTDPNHPVYTRVMSAGVWGPWAVDGSAVLATYLPLAGGIMTGQIKLVEPPVAPADAAAKSYVDNSIVAQAVRYDTAQALTVAQRLQARQNIFAAPIDAMAFNGMQINGAHAVSQQYGSTAVNLPSGSSAYVDDQWLGLFASATGSFVAGVAASGLGGLPSCLYLRASTATAMAGANDYAGLGHYIEGYRASRLGFGTGSAAPITIGFMVTAPVAGTFAVALGDGTGARSCVKDVTINAAGTWEYKTVTFPGDVAGSWNTTTAIGLAIFFMFGCGATYRTASPGVWTAGNFLATPSTGNFFTVNNNQVIITGLHVVPGNEAPPVERLPYIMRPFDQELLLCQRYFQKFTNCFITSGWTNVGFNFYGEFTLSPTMRVQPTVAFQNVAYSNASGLGNNVSRPNHVLMAAVSASAAAGYANFDMNCDARL